MIFNTKQKEMIKELHMEAIFRSKEDYNIVFDSFDDDEKEEVEALE